VKEREKSDWVRVRQIFVVATQPGGANVLVTRLDCVLHSVCRGSKPRGRADAAMPRSCLRQHYSEPSREVRGAAISASYLAVQSWVCLSREGHSVLSGTIKAVELHTLSESEQQPRLKADAKTLLALRQVVGRDGGGVWIDHGFAHRVVSPMPGAGDSKWDPTAAAAASSFASPLAALTRPSDERLHGKQRRTVDCSPC